MESVNEDYYASELEDQATFFLQIDLELGQYSITILISQHLSQPASLSFNISVSQHPNRSASQSWDGWSRAARGGVGPGTLYMGGRGREHNVD